MESLNFKLFLSMNAVASPAQWQLALATFFAEWLIFILPPIWLIGWLSGDAGRRRGLLAATAAVLFGLLGSQLISLIWPHPRPFMIGLGHTLIQHAPDASFPSDHLTLWWSAAAGLCCWPQWRRIGGVLMLAGIPMAWARIYLGVHFPFDMLGALVLAMVSAALTRFAAPWYLASCLNWSTAVYQRLFRRWINVGCLR